MRVDLNPARAGISDSLRESAHTSLQHRHKSPRIASGRALGRAAQDQVLKPVEGLVDSLSDCSEPSYIELVRWTGLQTLLRQARQTIRCGTVYPQDSLDCRRPTAGVDPTRPRDRESALPGNRLRRGTDAQGGRSRAAMDEGRFRRVRADETARTTTALVATPRAFSVNRREPDVPCSELTLAGHPAA